MRKKKLADLIPMESPDDVLAEALTILSSLSPKIQKNLIISAFKATQNLYQGTYPGYQACNTGYHDFRHTTDTFLAMIRLIHGATLDGDAFTPRQIVISLIAALLHDAGYIQRDNDKEGTGAKYSANHVQRSIDFFKAFGKKYQFTPAEIGAGKAMIFCTDLDLPMADISFPSKKIERLGKILGTVDLLAQMADRTYLEKLLFLFHEFREGNVYGFTSMEELLHQTVLFYDFISDRLKTALDGINQLMIRHFIDRWGIKKDLYYEAIENQKRYLIRILNKKETDIMSHLRRGGIAKKFHSKYGNLDSSQ